MNRIRHIRRTLAYQPSPPGSGEPHANQAQSQRPHPPSRPGRGSIAARFLKNLAAAAGVAAGQHRPAPAATNSRQRAIIAPRLLPRTIQLCIHCRQNPAGFWISRDTGHTVRRPWCLSCCQDLDPGRYHVQPFDS
jgi:hypothetical protein